MRVRVCVSGNERIFICLRAREGVCVYVRECMYVCVCMCVCVCVCVCVGVTGDVWGPFQIDHR